MQHRLTPDCSVGKHYLLDPVVHVAIPALHRDLVTRIGKRQHQVLPGARYRHVRRGNPLAQDDTVRANVLHASVLRRDVARLVDRVGSIAQVVQVAVRAATPIKLVVARATFQGVGDTFVVIRRVVREPLASAKQRVVTRSPTQAVAATPT